MPHLHCPHGKATSSSPHRRPHRSTRRSGGCWAAAQTTSWAPYRSCEAAPPSLAQNSFSGSSYEAQATQTQDLAAGRTGGEAPATSGLAALSVFTVWRSGSRGLARLLSLR